MVPEKELAKPLAEDKKLTQAFAVEQEEQGIDNSAKVVTKVLWWKRPPLTFEESIRLHQKDSDQTYKEVMEESQRRLKP